MFEPEAANLTASLNDLIKSLRIPLPFALESPDDLTPGLLLGLLESILQTRLPIAPAVRAARDFASKVHAMKVLLGVLETDVLPSGADAGLCDADPRRLASGEREEVAFVGELLCWLARRQGLLAGPSDGALDPGPPPVFPARARALAGGRGGAPSPSTHSTATSMTHSNLSMLPPSLAASDTTVQSLAAPPSPPPPLDALELESASLPDLPPLPAAPTPRPAARSLSASGGLSRSGGSSSRSQPRCIHEVEDPSFAAEFDPDPDATGDTSLCHCDSVLPHADEEGDDGEEDDDLPPTPQRPLPYRSAGWIDVADESSELRSYRARRTASGSRSLSNSHSHSHSPQYSHAHSSSRSNTSAPRIVTPHNAPEEYTLALLAERARLLEELARLKATPAAGG